MIPKFSNDPVQDAEMRAEYFWDCRITGENPFGRDPDEYDDFNDHYDDDEE